MVEPHHGHQHVLQALGVELPAPCGRVGGRPDRPPPAGDHHRFQLLRVRPGQHRPAELSGGTFTLNNYVVFGVDGSAPIINLPEVRKNLELEGAQPVGNTPAEFTAFVKAEREKWSKVVAEAAIKIE